MNKQKLLEGWKEAELGNQEYFTILSSGIDKFEGEKEYLSTESIKGTKISKIEATITYKDRQSRANMQPVLNSVWFAKMQATLKVYSFDEENKEEIKKYILSTGFAGIKVNEKLVSPKYLRLVLISNDFNGLKDKLSTGSTQKGINNQAIETISLVIPPLKVQKQIVFLLERVEKLKEKRQIANEATNTIIKSIFYEMFGDPTKNKHRRIELRELIEEFRYGTSTKSTAIGDPVLRIPNVISDAIDLSDLKYVQLEEKERSRLLLKNGDILFVRTNGNPNYVGRSAVFNLLGKYVYASYLIKASIKKELINPTYLVNFLRLPSERKQVLQKCRTSAGQYNINTEGLGALLIQVPPIDLQTKFAEIVNKLESLYKKQQQSTQDIINLFDALMQKAFKEELV